MIKKTISLILVFLLLTSTIYFPAFASSESLEVTYVPEKDRFEYQPDDETILIQENFDKGTIGNQIAGFPSRAQLKVTTAVPNDLPAYSSFTYNEGVAGNETQVGKFYDWGYVNDKFTRFNLDGTKDTNAKKIGLAERNRDGIMTDEILTDIKHVKTTFKFYNAAGAKEGSEAAGFLKVIHAQINGGISSTSPDITIYGDRAQLNFRDEADTSSGVQTISGLETGKWYDVSFETVYDSTNKKAISTLTIGDEYVTSYITNTTQNPPKNGYGEPSRVTFIADYNCGGLYYIDDLKISSIQKGLSSKSKSDVKQFTFDDYAANGSYNTQDCVYDDWTDGLPTVFTTEDGTEYKVEWSSSNPEVISTEGKVTRRAYDQVVTLTAKITDSESMYIKRYYDVLVPHGEGAADSDVLNEYVQYEVKASKYSSEVTESSNRITKALTLPTRDELAGVDISWSASPAGIIDVDTGELTRPGYEEEDVEVTLTAAVSINGSSPVTKDIVYTVAKLPNPTETITDAMNNIVLTDEPLEKITKEKINLPSSYGDVEITWDTSAHTQIDELGNVERGYNEVTAAITGSFSTQGVTLTKDYILTVYPTIERMIEIDIETIDKTGWDAITGDFTVPLIGEKYSSIFTWTSDNSLVKVGDEGKITVKRPPNSAASDLTANLIISGKLDTVEKEVAVPIVVLRQASDSVVAEETADKINFELIKGNGTGNTMDAVVNDLVLPTGFSYDSGIEIIWSSSHPEIVSTSGRVTRPIGENDVVVTLTANVKKGYVSASYSPTITFTVKAISDLEEIIKSAMDGLTFSQLSSEEIDSVTLDLTLPEVGNHGTVISWSSNSDLIKVEGTKGIVTRPALGTSGGVVLTASITYTDGSASTTVDKKFYITVLADTNLATISTLLNENFNKWNDASKFGSATSSGKWSQTDASKCGTEIGINSSSEHEANGVYIYLSHDSAKGVPGSLTYTSVNASSANVYEVKLSFYVPGDFSGNATIEVLSQGAEASRAVAYLSLIGSGSKVELTTAEGKVLSLNNGTFTKGAWNELVLDVDKKAKRYNVYLNDVCITENNTVKYKDTDENYDSSIGVQFKGSLAEALKDIRMTAEDGTIFIDNMSVTEYFDYSQEQFRAVELFEEQLFSTIDPTCVKDSFDLPVVRITGMRINCKSSSRELMYMVSGLYMKYNQSPPNPTVIQMTVTFDDGNSVLTKVYDLTLYPKDDNAASEGNDSVNAEKDLKTAVDFINGYNLSNLKNDIAIASIAVKNGSKMTYTSSNQNIITDSGKITRTDSTQQVTFTVTATKGDVTKSHVFEITVGTKSPVFSGGTGGTVSGGGGGGKPVYGGNASGNTGIDISDPEDDNNQGQTSMFTDVSKEHWAYDYIAFMVDNKIMNGVGDGRIEPERTINREEFVKMLVVALGLDLKDAAADFTDVDKDEWYAPYIATIKEKGLINGFEDGTFGIGQNITRQDLAVLIYRSSKLAKEDVKEYFTDDAEIADYAKDAVYTLRKLGVINGKEDGGFDPTAPASRAETAAMLYKAIKQGLFE